MSVPSQGDQLVEPQSPHKPSRRELLLAAAGVAVGVAGAKMEPIFEGVMKAGSGAGAEKRPINLAETYVDNSFSPEKRAEATSRVMSCLEVVMPDTNMPKKDIDSIKFSEDMDVLPLYNEAGHTRGALLYCAYHTEDGVHVSISYTDGGSYQISEGGRVVKEAGVSGNEVTSKDVKGTTMRFKLPDSLKNKLEREGGITWADLKSSLKDIKLSEFNIQVSQSWPQEYGEMWFFGMNDEFLSMTGPKKQDYPGIDLGNSKVIETMFDKTVSYMFS